jgi:hypothetical protein
MMKSGDEKAWEAHVDIFSIVRVVQMKNIAHVSVMRKRRC